MDTNTHEVNQSLATLHDNHFYSNYLKSWCTVFDKILCNSTDVDGMLWFAS